MPLRRLLRFSVAASGRLSRSLCSAASDSSDRWSWYMLGKTTAALGSAKGPSVGFANPPRISHLYMPEHLVDSGGLPLPDPESDVIRLAGGKACSASQDGFLLLRSQDIHFTAPIIAKQGGNKVRQPPTGLADPENNPDMTHYVFNPYTREVSSRLPEIQGPKKSFHLGILTQSDGESGPPDRYVVAELEGHLMLRFLSETGEWEIVQCSPCQLPAPAAPWRFEKSQEVVAFRGHLWWVDVTWGAVDADPFSERPELHFAELPSCSLLPADANDEAFRRGSQLPDRLIAHMLRFSMVV